ncbi:hypothetical protein M404DRAFT_32351 [Pisolithus tinctorius Marx 270]|uniref:Uncharacterized protein n=1 Tax=Pisolithus tinctorius Marx 270 TaxID=870435 RepID=A0A0C3IKC3_PISTI|nr:hypothetical protein M404DRAFT_32351 [Pisolithus tinctorius Marx 270]
MAIETNSDSQVEFHMQDLGLPPWPSVSQPPPPPAQIFSSLENMQAWPQFQAPSTLSSPLLVAIGHDIPRPTSSVPPPAQSNMLPSNAPSVHDRPDDNALSEVVAPLLSYFSTGMDTLLDSIRKLQAMSHETVMKEISTIHEQLRTSNLASKDQPGLGEGESGNSFH